MMIPRRGSTSTALAFFMFLTASQGSSSSAFRRPTAAAAAASILLALTSSTTVRGVHSLAAPRTLLPTATTTASTTASFAPVIAHRSLAPRTWNTVSSATATTTTTAFASLRKNCQPSSLVILRGGSTLAEDDTTTAATTTAEGTTATTTTIMSAASKLQSLRARMKELDLDVYLIPSDDPHLSEYTPDAYKRRGFLTDFHGSAGTAVVTHDAALLWTDSRYWNEASLNLDANHWTLQKQGMPSTPTIPKWLAEQAAAAAATEKSSGEGRPLRIGLDPYVHAASFVQELREALAAAAKERGDEEKTADNVGVIDTSQPNLVDPVWGASRPSLPLAPFRVHPLEYAGTSVADKVGQVRRDMEEKKATMSVFCTLDDVAYLFNMRAKGDVDTCPVGLAYAAVTMDDVFLYCDDAKVATPQVQEHLQEVTIKPYNAIVPDIKAHCETSGSKVWLDKNRANYALSSVIPEKRLLDAQNAITPMKACKNEVELQGMRRAHIVDGAAMAKFMAWLENEIVSVGRSVSEVEIDLKLTGFRAEQPGFLEVSFPTIAGVGSNGAIIHYRATEGTDLLKYLDKENPILIDSGGQYTYGTTDVTRTWHFGTPTPEFVDMYTRVLKGNIGLDTMIFPENTPGFALDVYARQWLWRAGVDYGHGTGHGVGAALNVHEGPMSISPRWGNKEVLKKGMVVSNEPGYYEDGKFGIRIENLLEIGFVKPEHNEEETIGEGAKSTEKKFLKFEKLTMIPIQKSLIDVSLLSAEECDWLDEYHATVLDKISPLLEEGSPAMDWLRKSCEKIDRQK